MLVKSNRIVGIEVKIPDDIVVFRDQYVDVNIKLKEYIYDLSRVFDITEKVTALRVTNLEKFQIKPSEYLVESEKKLFEEYLWESYPSLDGIENDIKNSTITDKAQKMKLAIKERFLYDIKRIKENIVELLKKSEELKERLDYCYSQEENIKSELNLLRNKNLSLIRYIDSINKEASSLDDNIKKKEEEFTNLKSIIDVQNNSLRTIDDELNLIKNLIEEKTESYLKIINYTRQELDQKRQCISTNETLLMKKKQIEENLIPKKKELYQKQQELDQKQKELDQRQKELGQKKELLKQLEENDNKLVLDIEERNSHKKVIEIKKNFFIFDNRFIVILLVILNIILMYFRFFFNNKKNDFNQIIQDIKF